MQTKEVLDAMLKDAKMPSFKLLRVDGGASQNNLLMQMQADAIQVRLSAFAVRECLQHTGGYLLRLGAEYWLGAQPAAHITILVRRDSEVSAM